MVWLNRKYIDIDDLKGKKYPKSSMRHYNGSICRPHFPTYFSQPDISTRTHAHALCTAWYR